MAMPTSMTLAADIRKIGRPARNVTPIAGTRRTSTLGKPYHEACVTTAQMRLCARGETEYPL